MAEEAAARRIAAVATGEGHVVFVTWGDGTDHDVDLSAACAHLCGGPFRSVAVVDGGGALRWADGTGIAVGELWDMALVQDAERLHRWADRRRLAPDALADALGLDGAAARRYLAGERPIPKTVKLAMIGYDVVCRPAR
ncbi:hypothetical protein [Azospirillum sp. ST 5-10]|uniref:hypothetical protein n=1 Tax=unclassified Azospirillum TaxID=2630922 RepID=UPI003F4A1D1B